MYKKMSLLSFILILMGNATLATEKDQTLNAPSFRVKLKNCSDYNEGRIFVDGCESLRYGNLSGEEPKREIKYINLPKKGESIDINYNGPPNYVFVGFINEEGIHSDLEYFSEGGKKIANILKDGLFLKEFNAWDVTLKIDLSSEKSFYYSKSSISPVINLALEKKLKPNV